MLKHKRQENDSMKIQALYSGKIWPAGAHPATGQIHPMAVLVLKSAYTQHVYQLHFMLNQNII